MKQDINIIFAETATPINVSVFAQIIASQIMKEGLQIDGRSKVQGTIKGIRASDSREKRSN